MTNRIGNKNIAQQRSKAERLSTKQTNIAMEAVKKEAAKAKYHNEVKGRTTPGHTA